MTPRRWIALSDCDRFLPPVAEAELHRGLLIFEIALPLPRAGLLLAQEAGRGALRLMYEPEAGFALFHRQGDRLGRHHLPGRLLPGPTMAQLRFSWDRVSDRWTLRIVPEGGRTIATGGSGVMPMRTSLVEALSRGGPEQKRDAALLWFGATDGWLPEAEAWLGPLTPVETPRGPVPVGRLQPGDVVLTADQGALPLLSVRRQDLPARGSFAPLRLRASYFGARSDLLVTPSQGIALKGSDVEYLTGEDEVLAEVRDLADGTRVLVEDRHAVLPWVALDFGRAALVRSGSCTLAVGSPYGIRRLSRAETYALRETRSASARSRFA